MAGAEDEPTVDPAPGPVAVLSMCRRAAGALHSATLAVVRAVVESPEAERNGCRVAELVSSELGVPVPLAKRLISVTRRVGAMPLLADALADGRVSLEHVKVIDGALSHRVDVIGEELQGELVELAHRMTFSRWAQVVRQAISLLDEDGGHRPERPGTLHVSRGIDGSLLLTGNFTDGVDAEVVESVLREEADREFHRWRADRKVNPDLPKPSRSELMARALANLVRRAAAQPLESTKPAAPLVVVAMEAGEPGVLRSFDGRRLPEDAAEAILANCEMAPLIVDTEGVPLWMGRAVRFGTAAQEVATAHRDGGCIHPGCTTPVQWTHMHHARWWSRDGGPTDVDNLPRLCGHHHQVVHQPGWSVERSIGPDGRPDGWWILTRPDGTRMWSQRHGRQRDGEPPPESVIAA